MSVRSATGAVLSEVSADQLEEPAYADLNPGDRVGATGLESQYDNILRGRNGAVMIYDPVRAVMVMFGGGNSSTSYGSDTWHFDGSDWTELTLSPVPRGRHGAVLAYDATRGVSVLFGGSNSSTPYGSDTWEYGPSGWTAITTAVTPRGRNDAVMAYDPDRGVHVLYGGANSSTSYGSDTWEL